jgi:uncharacterized OB-fold protein
MSPDRSSELAALVGQPASPVRITREAVNRPMIGHWIEAMDDADPIYRSDAAARAVGLSGVVAPPTMLQAWTMPGLRNTLAREAARRSGTAERRTGHEAMMALLDEEGLTSVVATNSEQEYLRPLVPGERLIETQIIESITDEKATALGSGRFVTTRSDYVAVPDSLVTEDADPAALAAQGEPVGSMRFRMLKFRPRAAAPARPPESPAASAGGAPTRPRRPRPAVTPDNAFFYQGAGNGQLLIQRCANCGRLRHPPSPACGRCRSLDWDTVEASGRGQLYSFVVVHHPQVPAFDYPLPIALVALEEGTRLVANLEAVDPADLVIGMALEGRLVAVDDDLSLPVFRPAGTPVPDGGAR